MEVTTARVASAEMTSRAGPSSPHATVARGNNVVPDGFATPRRKRPTEADDEDEVTPIAHQQLWLARMLEEEALREKTETDSEVDTELADVDTQSHKVRQLMENMSVLWSTVRALSAHFCRESPGARPWTRPFPRPTAAPRHAAFRRTSQASKRRGSFASRPAPPTKQQLAAAELIDQLLLAAGKHRPREWKAAALSGAPCVPGVSSTSGAQPLSPSSAGPASRRASGDSTCDLSVIRVQQLWLAEQLRDDAASVTSEASARSRSVRSGPTRRASLGSGGEAFSGDVSSSRGRYGLLLLAKMVGYAGRRPWLAHT